MDVNKKYLFQLLYNQRFIYNGTTYTVTQQSPGMAEVHGNGKYWAWPHYDGTKSITVDCITIHQPRQ